MKISMVKREWAKIGFLNLLEHFFVRAGDTAATLLVIWMLTPEEFGAVAIAGAWVAPCLLFFISPETIFFRDYQRLQAAGSGALQEALSTYRVFGWIKGITAIALAWGMSFLVPHRDEHTLPAMIWAFCFFSGAHVTGADREFLRISKKMGLLNRVSFLQKLILILSILGLSHQGGGSRLWPLAWIGMGWLGMSGLLFSVSNTRGSHGLLGRFSPQILSTTLRNFSIWHHIGGIIQQVVLMIDLFFLSFTGVPKSTLGLYGIGLKITNLLLALPMTIQSTVMVWVGNKGQTESEPSLRAEQSKVTRVCFGLGLILCLVSVVIYAAYPWVLRLLLRDNFNQFSAGEIEVFGEWLVLFLSGGVLISSAYPWIAYMHLRVAPRDVVLRLLLPWGVASAVCYGFLIFYRGIEGAAWGNLVTGGLFWGVAIRKSMINR